MKYALAALGGVVLTVLVWFGTNVFFKYEALSKAWNNSKIIEQLEIPEPTIQVIKK